MTTKARSDVVSVDTDAAIGAFVSEHYDRLLRLARLICRDSTDAADAVQLGFEHAWRGRSGLRDADRVRPWLDRIVAREAVRLARRRRSWLDRIFALHPDVEWIEPVDHRASEPSTFVALRAAFSTLSPEQRAVVALHLHRGYSISETAELVGAPEETVRSRLRLARQKLRRELEEDPR